MKCNDCHRVMKSTKDYTIEVTVFKNIQVLVFTAKLCRTCLSKRKKRQKI